VTEGQVNLLCKLGEGLASLRGSSEVEIVLKHFLRWKQGVQAFPHSHPFTNEYGFP
jgi:hypothetical protein